MCQRKVIEGLKNIGAETKSFGLHGLWAGGATAGANLKVKDRPFKKHGRWKSEKVKDGYIYKSIEVKLIVTKNVGLQRPLLLSIHCDDSSTSNFVFYSLPDG